MPATDALWIPLLACTVPLVYLLGAITAGPAKRSIVSGWPATLVYARCVLVVTAVLGVLYVIAPDTSGVVGRLPWFEASGLAPSVRVDPLTLAMLALIGFIGLIILTFSRHYLAGDPGSDDMDQRRYRRWFFATLASISTLVISNQMLILGVAWMATSLCLHQLLTYYGDRPQALLAAHKKFLSSRLADLFILSGLVIIGLHYDSFQMDRIFARVDPAAVTPALTAATALMACAAILKCAQLPFHGWLIQVMEAPTPVSALLHAGIVNMGGFLMIRFAPLMAHADLAQTLLIIAGTTTAVFAALIMATRVSIKVMLAWSTCAQMGFMLMECGVGLYNLALLHLLGHSFYKAHSFLNAGDMVAMSTRRAGTPAADALSARGWLLVGALAGLAVVVVFAVPGGHAGVFAVLVLALASLIGDSATAPRDLLKRAGVAALAVTALYLLWSFVSVFWVPAATAPAATAAQIGITLAFAALFIARAMLATPGGARRLAWLHPHVYGGFYLDQLFTRLTLILWPPRLPTDTRVASHSSLPRPELGA